MVSSGLKTKRFQQYLNEDYNIDGETAFSLVFPDRTFDLVAANVEERDRFVMAIKFIKSCL